MEADANAGCFACGAANPIGLGLTFAPEGEAVVADFTPSSWHQGYEGVIHGGIIATMLDEAMAHALLARGIEGVTARLNVRFLAPLSGGVPVRLRGRLRADRGRLVETEGEIIAGEGNVLASAEGLFAVKERHR